MFERYIIAEDLWEIWNLSDLNKIGPSIYERMGCAMLNENNIIVFGGLSNGEHSADTFLINVKKKNGNVIDSALN